VCCGGQLLAQALGARVHAGAGREIGGYDVELTEHGHADPLFAGFPDRFPVFHWHADTFDLPADAVHLVAGETCPYQAFRRKRAAALLFHLELSAWDVPNWIHAYADDFAASGKTTVELLEEIQDRDPRMHALADRLMENFLGMA